MRRESGYCFHPYEYRWYLFALLILFLFFLIFLSKFLYVMIRLFKQSVIRFIEESTKKHPFPCPCSYRTALTHYLNITSNPRTHVLKELAEYATDPAEKEKLKLMASTTAEGKAAYQQWIIQENRNIVHILEDIHSLKPSLDYLCEILPRLLCRYYSISSSPKVFFYRS
jgi:NADPH-ferrihemoprotein reductase